MFACGLPAGYENAKQIVTPFWRPPILNLPFPFFTVEAARWQIATQLCRISQVDWWQDGGRLPGAGTTRPVSTQANEEVCTNLAAGGDGSLLQAAVTLQQNFKRSLVVGQYLKKKAEHFRNPSSYNQ